LHCFWLSLLVVADHPRQHPLLNRSEGCLLLLVSQQWTGVLLPNLLMSLLQWLLIMLLLTVLLLGLLLLLVYGFPAVAAVHVHCRPAAVAQPAPH